MSAAEAPEAPEALSSQFQWARAPTRVVFRQQPSMETASGASGASGNFSIVSGNFYDATEEKMADEMRIEAGATDG
jgi:hypothetical protein